MNELVKNWLEELRGGRYGQTTGKLATIDGSAMCCLGVLCEVSGKGKWEPDSENRYLEFVSNDLAHDATAPNSVWQATGKLAERIDQQDLAKKNDNGYTFEEIALYIEEVLAE